jgi:septum site-determining protein MinD
MAKIITVTSGKGGVGKTTTAINLGAALNEFGKEVVVLDANLTTPNVGLHLGAPIVPVSLNHVLSGKAKITDAIYEHESGTKIVPGSLSAKELKKWNNEKLNGVGKKLKRMAEYVIYDGAAGLGEEAKGSLEAADEIILVTNPEIPAVTDALKTAKVVEGLGKEIKGVVITRVRGNRTEMPIENVAEMLELPILGIVPEDGKMQAALVKKDALVHTHPNSKAARAYKKIASRLEGIEYKEPGFWARFFGS